jgi:hypothetical protein
MAARLVLAPSPKEYNKDHEEIRNREIQSMFKQIITKLAELEERIKALEP